MKRERVEFTVYLVGVIVFGLAYQFLKSLVSGPVFLLGALVYVLVLRLLGRYLSRRI
jgi:hypothetical protein